MGSPTEVIIPIGPFLGLNTSVLPSQIEDNEFAALTDFEHDIGGSIVTRRNFLRYSEVPHNDGPTGITFQAFIDDRIIVKTGFNETWYSGENDFTTWTEITQPGPASVTGAIGVYLDKLYIIDSTTVWEWDPANPTNNVVNVGASPGSLSKLIQFKDRFFAPSGSPIATSFRLWFSDLGDPTSWPGTNFIDIGKTDESIKDIIEYQDYIIIFKEHSIWRLDVFGDPADWVLAELNSHFGSTSSVYEFKDGLLYFLAHDGLYRTDLTTFELVSGKVSDFFDRRAAINATSPDTLTPFNDGFYLDFEEFTGIGSFNRTQLYFNAETETWSKWDPIPFGLVDVDHRFASYIEITETGGDILRLVFDAEQPSFDENVLILASPDNNKSAYNSRDGGAGEVGAQNLPVSFFPTFKTKEFDFGARARVKRIKWILMDMEVWDPSGGAASVDIEIKHYVDGSVVDTINIQFANTGGTVAGNRRPVKIPGPGYFRKYQLELTVITEQVLAAYPLRIHGIEFVLEPKRTQLYSHANLL